jgi:glycosyltransferase involved in cell wall biosynthesis
MKIGFLVGDIFNISGGSNVIIEHAAGLKARGHEVMLISAGEPPPRVAWHPALIDLDVRSVDGAAAESFDFVFATWWVTYFDLHRLKSRVYGYFNQSLESRFHPERHYKLLNRSTYSLPLLYVTEAKWLAEFIGTVRPEAKCLYVRNGLSSELFPRLRAVAPRQGPLRVLVEGPWAVPFKGVPGTFDLLDKAAAKTQFEVGWLSSDCAGARPVVGQRPVRIHEQVPIDQVRHVMRQYDLVIKLSRVEGMFGPPLEMFSQGGTAIATTVTGSDEYLEHGHNALVVEPYNVEQIPRYLELLSKSPELLRHLKTNALKTAKQWPTWETACREFGEGLEQLAASKYQNANLRSALAGSSALRGFWLDSQWRFEAKQRAWRHIGDGEWILMNRYRQLKASQSVGFLKRVLPRAVKKTMRDLFYRVIE